MSTVIVLPLVGMACFLAGALAAALGFYHGLKLSMETFRKEAKHGRMR